MPINWLAAAKVVPWLEILKQAPALASAADRLLSKTKRSADAADTGDETEGLHARIGALEARDRENALLLKQLADQVERLTGACRILAARQRLLYWISGGAALLAVAALAVAIGVR